MTEDSLEKVVDSKLGAKIINIIIDRLHEGVVFVNNQYEIVHTNRILEEEFGYSPNVGESYFDFFFGHIPEDQRAEHPISKVFEGKIKEPFSHAKLAKDNYYYDVVTYPLQTDPNLVIEIWSKWGSKEFIESLEAYQAIKLERNIIG